MNLEERARMLRERIASNKSASQGAPRARGLWRSQFPEELKRKVEEEQPKPRRDNYARGHLPVFAHEKLMAHQPQWVRAPVDAPDESPKPNRTQHVSPLTKIAEQLPQKLKRAF